MKAIGRTRDCTLSVLEKTRVRVAIACWSSMVVGRSMRRLLKESWLFLFWHFEFFQKFFQLSNFNLIISRGWRTFFHIFRNDLWYSCVESLTSYFLIRVRWWKKMIEFRRNDASTWVLELLKVKIKKKQKKKILVPFRLSSKHRNPLRLLFPFKR